MKNKPEQWTFLGVLLTSSTVIIPLFIPRCFWARAPNQDSGNRLARALYLPRRDNCGFLPRSPHRQNGDCPFLSSVFLCSSHKRYQRDKEEVHKGRQAAAFHSFVLRLRGWKWIWSCYALCMRLFRDNNSAVGDGGSGFGGT